MGHYKIAFESDSEVLDKNNYFQINIPTNKTGIGHQNSQELINKNYCSTFKDHHSLVISWLGELIIDN